MFNFLFETFIRQKRVYITHQTYAEIKDRLHSLFMLNDYIYSPPNLKGSFGSDNDFFELSPKQFLAYIRGGAEPVSLKGQIFEMPSGNVHIEITVYPHLAHGLFTILSLSIGIYHLARYFQEREISVLYLGLALAIIPTTILLLAAWGVKKWFIRNFENYMNLREANPFI
jgi:hypothetical protein